MVKHKNPGTDMSMGGPGDHPITDLIHHGENPFPADIADMLRELHSYDPTMRNTFAIDAWNWADRHRLDEGRTKLRAELAKHRTQGK
jgi:hypothetical protein